MTLLRRFAAMPRADRFLVLEAFAALTLASVAIACLPFRAVTRLASWRGAVCHVSVISHEPVRNRVRWAITAWARRMPWKVLCFQEGLAAQWMLRRRGVASTLYYGVGLDQGSALQAHVWVCDGDVFVIGGETAHQFKSLATFPPPD